MPIFTAPALIRALAFCFGSMACLIRFRLCLCDLLLRLLFHMGNLLRRFAAQFAHFLIGMCFCLCYFFGGLLLRSALCIFSFCLHLCNTVIRFALHLL